MNAVRKHSIPDSSTEVHEYHRRFPTGVLFTDGDALVKVLGEVVELMGTDNMAEGTWQVMVQKMPADGDWTTFRVAVNRRKA